jgi:hypothetical protein
LPHRPVRPVFLLAAAALAGCASHAPPRGPVPPTAAPAVAPEVAAPTSEASPALVPMAELRGLTREAPWECHNYDEATRTCDAIGRTTWRDLQTGFAESIVMFDDDPRVVAAISGEASFERDRACARMADASVELAETTFPPRVAEKLEALILEMKAAKFGSSVVCTGWTRDGDGFRTVNFRDGTRTGES